MFTQLRERALEKLKNLAPQDELDKLITRLVETGSDPERTSPAWDVNMSLCDVVSSDPEVTCEKLLRIVRLYVFAKPVVRTQVLALTMLDTCVRNCHPILHTQLASSVLWADLLKLVQDTSVTRVDLEVRDRILSMIEDYGKCIKEPPTFYETYETLVDQGVDFPVRSADEVVPFEPVVPPAPAVPAPHGHGAAAAGAAGAATAVGAGAATAAAHGPSAGHLLGSMPVSNQLQPPAQPQRTAPRLFSNFLATFGGGSGGGAAPQQPSDGAAPPGAGTAPTAPHVRGQQPPRARTGGVDPAVLEGLSEEDRVAVQAAMAEMAAESESAQEAAAMAASLQDAAAGQTGLSGAQGEGTGRGRAPALPENDAEALQVISSNVQLLCEMVSGISDDTPGAVRDPLIRDLAETAASYRSRLGDIAREASDEGVLNAALAQNDMLGGTLARYDALLAQALVEQAALPASETDTAARAAAATTAIVSSTGPTAASAAGGAFTLLDEGEDDAEDEGLVTRRQQVASPAAPPADPAPEATDEPAVDPAPTPAAPAPAPQPDLI